MGVEDAMGGGSKRHAWALVQSEEYAEDLGRLSSKHRSQVARKAMDLTHNPQPGGSKTKLVGYDGLCRVRAGDYRIIYAYDDKVVQLLTLRRRAEDTYDNLDALELQRLEGFELTPRRKPEAQRVADWDETARQWAAPKPHPPEQLPGPIVENMLRELAIPPEHWPALLAVTTADGLLDCDPVPFEHRERVLEHLCPKKAPPSSPVPQPIVLVADMVDSRTAGLCGPIVADGYENQEHAVTPGVVPEPLAVVSTKELDPMKPYSGNLAKGIAKDSRYTVKLDGTIQLLYHVGDREHALLTTDLIKLVNEAKRAGGSSAGGGGFVINEYRHVLVPTQKSGVLFAGVYTRDLEFAFEGTTISPVASSTIKSGDVWPGPHVGIRYTLAAGASDVRYEVETPRGTIRTVKLTDYHGPPALAGILGLFRAVKPNGGAVYVNEAREVFAPVDDGGGYKRRYICHLGDHPWFPEPV